MGEHLLHAPPLGRSARGLCAAPFASGIGGAGLPLSYRDQVEYRADVGGGLIEHELVDIFVARVDRQIDCRHNPDEVMQTEWIALQDLRARIHATPERFTPWLRIYLDQHAGQIFA